MNKLHISSVVGVQLMFYPKEQLNYYCRWSGWCWKRIKVGSHPAMLRFLWTTFTHWGPPVGRLAAKKLINAVRNISLRICSDKLFCGNRNIKCYKTDTHWNGRKTATTHDMIGTPEDEKPSTSSSAAVVVVVDQRMGSLSRSGLEKCRRSHATTIKLYKTIALFRCTFKYRGIVPIKKGSVRLFVRS